jgi:hypothetical protein
MDWIKTNRYIATATFVFTLIVYALTVSPTVSYWDCGEFIACSYGLMVPHPPGAPFFLLIGRLFSMNPFIQDIGLRVNYISVISSAITIMLLYLSIVHIVREWKGALTNDSDWLIAIFSGLIGSLTFAFTHSFWFNAVEAEVYAPSILFMALIVWLILVWAEKSDQLHNERYLLMISYIIGLAIGVHLLNILALPFVTMIYYYKRFEFNMKTFIYLAIATVAMLLFIYPGIVKILPRIAEFGGALGLALVFIGLIALVFWSYNNNKRIISLLSLSVLNPIIDENNPENIERFISYLNREQYGDHSITDRAKVWRESPNGKQYHSVGEFFWKYQINKMYIRYFLWQFAGMHENEKDWSFNQFYAIPFLLGLLGAYWHFKNDSKHALAVLALFFMTGLAVILYLNQPDPQPRERDYSYVGSFFAFSIWIGLGFAGIIELIKGGTNDKKESESKSQIVQTVIFVILLIAAPIHLLAKNFDSHSRKGRYIAWDYSYNMLQTCEPNAILITNGDNDTFPLWYLQEVDSVRRDVRVVNLSLLNTDWYIQQLKDLEPKVPIRMSNAEVGKLGLYPWKKKKVSVEVPRSVGEQQAQEFRSGFQNMNINVPEKISFEVKPTINTPYGPMIRVQDHMVLRIINWNKWQKPIYFAVTVSKNNMLDELQDYMRMDGLALKLVPYKNWRISPEHLERNLTQIYKYRGLQDPDVFYDKNIIGLLQNYRTAFLQLVEYYSRDKNMAKVKLLMDQMEENLPSAVIPWTNKYLRLIKDSYTLITNDVSLDSILNQNYNEQELSLVAENLYRLNHFDKAEQIFETIFQSNPNNVNALSLLINIYEKTGNYEKGVSYLESWLQRRPNDPQARKKLESFKEKI